MKRTICTLIAAMVLGLATTASAQQFRENEIGVALGAGSATQIAEIYMQILLYESGAFTEDNFIGPFSAEYFRYVYDNVALGGIFCYTQYTKDITKDGNKGQYKDNYYTLMPALKFLWVNGKNFGLYSKVAAGVTYSSWKDRERETDAWHKDHAVLFNYHASVLGIEVGARIKAFAEIGYGEQGIGLIGLRARF